MKYTVLMYFPFFEDEEIRRIPLRRLAEMTGVHYTYLCRLKKGQAVASEEMYSRLSKFLVDKRTWTPETTPTTTDKQEEPNK